VDLLFNPRAVARSVAPWLALVLLLLGAGSLVFDQLVLRPEIVRFSQEGRLLVGRVGTPSRPDPSTGTRQAVPNRTFVAVDDPELGPQLVSIYGRLPLGSMVPVLCLTPARRCMAAEEVKERFNLWPLTPLTLTGSGALVLAGLLAFVTRRSPGTRRVAVPL
jgi:hypothetical protein